VVLESNLMLAPIAGWCEHAWRVAVRKAGGVGLACTDLLSPTGLICGSEASRDLAHTNGEDQPIGMQLYGSDPEIMARGAVWCAEHGATVVDINMGCPVDKVCKKDGGSKLMCDLPNTFAIFERVRAELPGTIPLTAKMRLGWDEDAKRDGIAGELAKGLCERGAACITVHGRTTAQKFKGSCDHDGIARVVDAVNESTDGAVPVLGNGDVKSAMDVVTMRAKTGCAGVMIGRGAFGDPFIFRKAWALQRRIDELGVDPKDADAVARIDLEDVVPSDDEVLALVLDYFERMIDTRGERHAMHVIRQKISWLGKSIRDGHSKALKESIRTAKDPGEVRGVIGDWCAGSGVREPGAC
jgi:nifR3 family TIM-barrel protein